MTEPREQTEGDDHERAWQRDTEDVLSFLEAQNRLDCWLGVPADNELDAEEVDDAPDQ